jgi:hypothetical protein
VNEAGVLGGDLANESVDYDSVHDRTALAGQRLEDLIEYRDMIVRLVHSRAVDYHTAEDIAQVRPRLALVSTWTSLIE